MGRAIAGAPASRSPRVALRRMAEGALAQELTLKATAPVADAAVDFLRLLLTESLFVRDEEWRSRNFSIEKIGIGDLRMAIRPGIRRLIRSAGQSARGRGSDEILAIDIACALSGNWCRVWPFCAATRNHG